MFVLVQLSLQLFCLVFILHFIATIGSIRGIEWCINHFLQGIKKIDYLVDLLVDHCLVETFLQNHLTDCQRITKVNNKAWTTTIETRDQHSRIYPGLRKLKLHFIVLSNSLRGYTNQCTIETLEIWTICLDSLLNP